MLHDQGCSRASVSTVGVALRELTGTGSTKLNINGKRAMGFCGVRMRKG